MRAPSDLKKPGRHLWRWVTTNFHTTGVEPLLSELCHVADRLSEVRGVLAQEGVLPASGKGKQHALVNAEVKLSGQFMRLWRTVGLADETKVSSPVGRPSVSEDMCRARYSRHPDRRN
jgi:hypothetical protein